MVNFPDFSLHLVVRFVRKNMIHHRLFGGNIFEKTSKYCDSRPIFNGDSKLSFFGRSPDCVILVTVLSGGGDG